MVGEKITVMRCCLVLEVSRSGYYQWTKRPQSERSKQTHELSKRILHIHQKSRGTYGMPRILETLKQEGQCHGKNRVVKIMKKLKISGVLKKKFKIKTTDSKHNLCFSMSNHMKTDLIKNALFMALGRQGVVPNELITHSDRGVQYASEDYRESLRELKIIPSMSRRGNCYDNAYAESFFSTLKKELIYRNRYKTREEAKAAVFEYIECWYNRRRIHSSLGYLTPVMYEKNHTAA